MIVVALVLRFFSEAVDVALDFVTARLQRETKTIHEVKENLEDDLRDLEAPVLVVLDDIDRLTPAETLELFQLVKVNADFPNLVYLMLFDRSVVEENLETMVQVSGRDYLEKIVQVGFGLPVVDQGQVDRVLFEGLNRVLASEEAAEHFDKTRWGNLYYGALQPYFNTLRDVNRYLSTFEFHASLFREERSFEVNPIDLIGLEVLRVFEPEVYQQVAQNKRLLTSGRPRRRGGQNEEKRERIQSIVEAGSQEGVEELLKQLFPSAEWAFGGSSYASGFRGRWFRELRVCSEDRFDRYFRLTIPKGDIPQGEIRGLLSAADDRNELRSRFEVFAEEGLLAVLFEHLEAYTEDVPLDAVGSFVTAIFDVGDDLPEERGGMFSVSPQMRAIRVAYQVLRRLDGPEGRADTLRRAIEETRGLSVPVQMVAIERQGAEREDESDRRLVTDDQLEELESTAASRIQEVAENGNLRNVQNLASVMYRWQEWADDDAPRRYCENLSQTPEGALILAKAFLHRSLSHGFGDYVSRERWYINIGEVEEFVSWERIDEQLEALDTESLNPEEQRAVEAFQEAADRRRRGEPDLDPRTRDF